jgi:DNA-binding NarL/FixJ family response regulator
MAELHHGKKDMSPGSTRLLLADDNPAMLEMLVDMLAGRYVIAGTVNCGASVVAQAMSTHPDIVLLDVSLGDMTGFDVARRLSQAGCTAKILFLSVHENPDFVRAGFDLGASGYVFKSQISLDLLRALDVVSDGQRFTPRDAAALPD